MPPEPLIGDVVVIGAGAIGASCAFHLAAAGLRVVVLETFDGPAEGSTGRSFASVRGQWADALNIELSWRSIQRYRDFPRDHGIDLGYRASGYLLLVGPSGWAAQLAAVELQREFGLPVEVLDPAAAQAITAFDADGIAGATWGPSDGVVDPHLTAAAFLGLARDRGATTLFRHQVAGIEAADDGSWTVRAGDRTVRSQFLVNTAGGWSGEIAALAGLQVPVVHSRRNVYASALGSVREPVPMTIDVACGLFVRSEGSRLLFGRARPDQADGYDTTVDWPWMESVLETGCDRFPWLADLPLDRRGCWAGTYEVTPDHHGIVGADPVAPTWINACGFSGHGLMQAPEIGRLVAEQVVCGAITSLDVAALRIDRFTGPTTGHIGLVF